MQLDWALNNATGRARCFAIQHQIVVDILGTMYGEVVRRARLAQGLTQAVLAEISGIDQPNISAIETGRRQPSADTFHRLLDACGFVLEAHADDVVVRIAPPYGNGEFDAARPGEDAMPDEPPVRYSARERARVVAGVLGVAEAVIRGRSWTSPN